MSHLDELKEQLEEAVAAQDFETAGRLRVEIEGIQRSALVRNVEKRPQASYFQRQVPGRMGLGTDQPVPRKPEGWVPPKKPDPMTANHSRGGRRTKS
ncbi:UvrB/UvrC motif-containing protein [Caulobacter sp. 602-1]|uniref:UvrB/UvrC motif-containing protein n=1 Tax=unclassified Caulobacter TaxID=2648921 RepID=UPI000F6372F4|nr:UvrB/UvrC motif-containing protein [Caulobacter sp. 602-1]RRN65514.1 excinuclease ABC subunit B [Caulobacter sp. 602-1]